MLKLLKNWKFILLITIFALYILYFSVSFQDQLQLPSKGWSRNLSISELKFDDSNIYESTQNNNIFTLPIPAENIFINFWFDSNTINYSVLNTENLNISSGKLDLNIESVKKIRAISNDDLIYLYSLESENLKKYVIDYDTKDILSSQTLSESVKDFIINKDLLLYSNDSSFNILNSSGQSKQIENTSVEKFEIVKDSDSNLYHIVFSEKTSSGNDIIKYMTYDLVNMNFNINEVTEVAGSITASLDGLDIGIVKGNIDILFSIRDRKFGTNNLYLIKFPQNDVSSFSKTSIAIDSSNPNPRILKDNNEILTFIASVNIIKGRDKETVNLVKYTLDEHNNISSKQLLTKTNILSLNPYYFSLNNHNYLVWTDIVRDNKQILFASNEEKVVKASQRLSGFEILDLFLATFTSIIPSSYFSVIPILYIFVPTLFSIFIISLINLSWVENYSLKRFSIIIIIHSIFKILYSHSGNLYNGDIQRFLPVFLRNQFIFYIFLLLTTLISLYCVIDYYKKSHKSIHLVKLYSIYASFDLIIYCFLTVPYIYSYLALTYKLNMY